MTQDLLETLNAIRDSYKEGFTNGKKETIEKVCDFISNNLKGVSEFDEYGDEYGDGVVSQSVWESENCNTISDFIEKLKKTLEK